MARSAPNMGVQAIARQRLNPARTEAVRVAGATFVWSRLLVLAVALVAVAVAGADPTRAARFDEPALTHPFGGFADSLFSPLARWDTIWYLGIAHSGYSGANSAFFPLYPLLVRLAAVVPVPATLLIASYAVSAAAFCGALYLLYRLASLELGDHAATTCVLLLAFFPGALWFGAPYSESVFLLLSVGAFYAARSGRWAWAGACAALASGTRSAGIMLLVPLLILWWQERPRRARDLAWIGLAPVGLAAYSIYLAIATGDGFAYAHMQDVWFRTFAGPLGAVPDGAVAAWDGLRQIFSGQRIPVYFTAAGGDPMIAASHNIELFAFLLLALIAVVGVVRRLPPAYGAYVIASLALPLSYPVRPQPLMSLPRFLAVLFPLFMWLALVCRTERRRAVMLALLAAGLIAYTVRYATWHWVA